MSSSIKYLILPGIYNSDAGHWQTRWETILPNTTRVQQRDWDHPVCSEWVATIEQTIQQQTQPVILVAHSLGCLTVAHWAAQTQQQIEGALLVSVPDPQGANFPKDAQGYDNTPMQALPFKSIVVCSTNDPYGSETHMRQCSQAWGSEFIVLGDYGHINASSGLGNWEQGQALLAKLSQAA
ncbi:alpha/beta fold hydrolase [uncultured Thiothrix sp.]|uniref:RBBP9/YdeN family alpha/beta hydrolase n=1 Tax=uncultured Thiothrix sp. TaxID=223185 RepID=UPI002604DA00|nr:alpha/beta fold hydrolase [uncultured Thiothrix sp.]